MLRNELRALVWFLEFMLSNEALPSLIVLKPSSAGPNVDPKLPQAFEPWGFGQGRDERQIEALRSSAHEELQAQRPGSHQDRNQDRMKWGYSCGTYVVAWAGVWRGSRQS